MCATVVLRSQDCLRKPYYTRRNTTRSNNPNLAGSGRRKRSPSGFESNVQDRSRVVVNNPDLRRPPARDSVAAKNSNLVMGQVKILKRGDPLPVNDDIDGCNLDDKKKAFSTPVVPEKAFKKLGPVVGRRDLDDMALCSIGRLGPEPEMVRKQITASDFYAGSGPIVASPPPSSLPVPAFFSKKEKKIDEATSDLLRLLRLDLA